MVSCDDTSDEVEVEDIEVESEDIEEKVGDIDDEVEAAAGGATAADCDGVAPIHKSICIREYTIHQKRRA